MAQCADERPGEAYAAIGDTIVVSFTADRDVTPDPDAYALRDAFAALKGAALKPTSALQVEANENCPMPKRKAASHNKGA